MRRKDRTAAGLTYRQRFSQDFNSWQIDNSDPAVLADDGANEIVSVPFPSAGAGGKFFFSLEVRIAP